MDFLRVIDHRLFLAINHLPHTAALDAIALFFSGVGAFGIIWFVLAFVLFLKKERRHHLFFIPIGLAGAISGVAVNLVLKPLVARARPDGAIGAIVIGESLMRDYGFPSGHATISFAAAAVLSRTEPKWRPALYLLAVLISLSRIYLGKHYPLDVAAGALLGWGIGYSSILMCYHVLKHGNRGS